MNRGQRRLDRAEEVTAILAEAGTDFLKIAVVLADELLPLFSWAYEDGEDSAQITEKADAQPGEILVPMSIYLRNGNGRHGVLRSIHPIHELTADLLAGWICPPPTPGNNKRESCYSYPFFLGAFSALAHCNELPEAMLQLCEAGRDKAGSMAMDAVFFARANTLKEIQQGMDATKETEYKHDRFSRHVVAVRNAYRELVEKKMHEPLKADVQTAAIEQMKKRGIDTYDQRDSARWREIYKSAGLTNLKQKRGKG
jgi:hypothetical protein